MQQISLSDLTWPSSAGDVLRRVLLAGISKAGFVSALEFLKLLAWWQSTPIKCNEVDKACNENEIRGPQK